jgi:hypothetical protein
VAISATSHSPAEIARAASITAGMPISLPVQQGRPPNIMTAWRECRRCIEDVTFTPSTSARPRPADARAPFTASHSTSASG